MGGLTWHSLEGRLLTLLTESGARSAEVTIGPARFCVYRLDDAQPIMRLSLEPCGHCQDEARALAQVLSDCFPPATGMVVARAAEPIGPREMVTAKPAEKDAE